MIDEKKLIEDIAEYMRNVYGCDLEDVVGFQTNNESKSAYIVQGLYEAVSIIYEQPKNDWIPCSERLPSAGREVLLQTKGNQMVVAFLDKKNKWYVDSGDYFCTDLCAGPIAWQPLPEPYKEDM